MTMNGPTAARPWRTGLIRWLAGCAAALAAPAAIAAPLPSRLAPVMPDNPAALCPAAIAGVEHAAPLPAKLLGAIAVTESGRPVAGRVVAWPWTIDVNGVGHFFETKADAIAAVQAFQATGVRSIDVGCMQINLMHHPAAFASLEEAFDPPANAAYAARFLTALVRETGNWPDAVAAYHSRTPDLSADYRRRVMAVWPLAASYGGDLATPPPMPAAARAPKVDPYAIYTPAFARQLAEQAADLARLEPKLNLPTTADATPKRAPRRPRGRMMAELGPGLEQVTLHR